MVERTKMMLGRRRIWIGYAIAWIPAALLLAMKGSSRELRSLAVWPAGRPPLVPRHRRWSRSYWESAALGTDSLLHSEREQ